MVMACCVAITFFIVIIASVVTTVGATFVLSLSLPLGIVAW
jgi:hypothetical protein